VTGDEIWIYHGSLRDILIGRCRMPVGWMKMKVQGGKKKIMNIKYYSNEALLMYGPKKGEKVDHFYYIDHCFKPVVLDLEK